MTTQSTHRGMSPCGQAEGLDRRWLCGEPRDAHPAVAPDPAPLTVIPDDPDAPTGGAAAWMLLAIVLLVVIAVPVLLLGLGR